MSNTKNILLILCDQLRYDFLGAYGGPWITPNIDKLAEDGMVFDNAYCAAPVCAPARMTMLTGLHPSSCPLEIPRTAPTTAGILSSAGFHTVAIGKMHMIPPRGPYGFRELVLSEDTGPGIFLDDFHPWLASQGLIERCHGLDNWDLLSCVNPLPEDKTVTAWNGSAAVDFLKKQDKSALPFFAVVSFVKPHPPYDPPLPWANRVKPEEAPAPRGLDRPWDDYPEQVRLFSEACGFSKVEESGCVRRIRAHYMGLTAQVDHEIGRILKVMAEQGLDDDTLIVFSADHGDFLGDHHLFYKNFPYEASAHIPLIMRGPGVTAGRCDIPVSHLDFAPTFFDFCDRKIPESCQGSSLLELLRKKGQGREGVVFQFGSRSGFCFVARTHKYALWPDGDEELFHLATDPEEGDNLVRKCPQVRDRLRESLLNELLRFDKERVGDVPAIFDHGKIIDDMGYKENYKIIARRFLHHRIPPAP